MDWQQALEENRQTLRRLVVMILGLARLAERIAGASRPRRAFILWLMFHAEHYLRDYVAAEAFYAGVPMHFAPTLRAGSEPADALRFARRWRILAAKVRRLETLAVRLERRLERRHRASLKQEARRELDQAAPTVSRPRAHDVVRAVSPAFAEMANALHPFQAPPPYLDSS